MLMIAGLVWSFGSLLCHVISVVGEAAPVVVVAAHLLEFYEGSAFKRQHGRGGLVM